MKQIVYSDTDKYYWCAYGNDDAMHFGLLEDGQRVSTGQPTLENYATEAALSLRVDELAGEHYYYVHSTQEPVEEDAKAEIQAWMTEKGIDFKESHTKAELIILSQGDALSRE